MGNTYKCVRLEPQCKYDNNDCVCNVVIGLTAEDGEGNSAYIDGVYSYPEGDMPTVAEFTEGANALVSQFAADNGWVASLDSQIESRKVQPRGAEEFEAPEITVDTSVEAAEGSHANPTPEPEPEPPAPEEPVVEDEVVEEPVEGE
jgi:hypothetical protein